MSSTAGSAACFHCTHRPELVNDPDFSIQWVVGKKNTSVWISAGSTSKSGAFQNSADVVISGSSTTSHFRFASESKIRLESGPMLTDVIPLLNSPCRRPASASSWIVIHDQFLSGLGSHVNAKSLACVAAGP